jgi:NCAIR mutase (PurE)-related protein
MTPKAIQSLLERVARGDATPAEASEELKRLPFSDLGFARVDHHRELRSGIPEVVFGERKTSDQIVAIARAMLEHGQRVLVTRLDADKAAQLLEQVAGFRYDAVSRTARHDGAGSESGPPGVAAVISAGTADQAVAEEAAQTLDFLGVRAVRLADVGVAGIHRLLASRDAMSQADVAIVVAGMEGALPSVVGGLVDVPVIAVPTSVGYGASFGGLAALLAMMNSCAAGVTVVNIDNGFGAAVAASTILRGVARLARS